MIKADERVMRAFISPDGQIILDFIRKCFDAKTAEALVTDAPAVYRSQGAANELNEIIDLANNARDRLHS